MILDRLEEDCCCSVIKSCPTLCYPIDCSMPAFPALHSLLEFVQTHVHWVGDVIQPSHPMFPFSSCPQSFPASGSFPMSRLLASGGQNIGASASVSAFPINIQGWFPLGLTGLISLLSKGLSRVFTSSTIWEKVTEHHRNDNMGLWTWMPCQVNQLHGFHCRRQVHFYVTKCQEEHRSTKKKMVFPTNDESFSCPKFTISKSNRNNIIQYLGRHIYSCHSCPLYPFYFESWVGGMLSGSARWILK